MRKLLSLGLVLAAVAGVALADGAHKGKAKLSKFMGTVASVDAAGGKLSATDKTGAAKDFTVGAEAKVTRNGKKAALADVVAGDSVTVSSTEDGTVKSVAAKAPKAPKAKK